MYMYKLMEVFPGDSVVKNRSAVQEMQEMWFDPWVGRSPGEGNCNPPRYSCLGNPMDRGAWLAIVHGVARVGHDLATKPPYHHKIYGVGGM